VGRMAAVDYRTAPGGSYRVGGGQRQVVTMEMASVEEEA
jgi:hypothetical protein